jgi:hypothetical protein
MSVGRHNFLIYGIKSSNYYEFCPKSDIDNYEQEKIVHVVEVDDIWELDNNNFREDPKLVILQDGFNGEYSILGILVKYAGNMEDGDGDFNERLTKQDIDFLHSSFVEQVSKNINIIQALHTGYYQKDNIGLIAITHYT